jgi:hypothetical protein
LTKRDSGEVCTHLSHERTVELRSTVQAEACTYLSHGRVSNNIRISSNRRPLPLSRDGLRQKYAGAAGGQFIILPYPAANELSGIYVTKFARGVDTREVKSRFDNSRPLVPTLRLALESTLFKPA